MTDFNLTLISAGFEHGGNVTHRHLDGHPELFVYPFESQLGSRNFHDFLASVERVQYRYPEFPEGLSAFDLYEQIIDEEMKTFLRKRNGSKFKDADLQLNEDKRIKIFSQFIESEPYSRKRVIEAFFRSTFEAWENYYKNDKTGTYVGYSPTIGIDTPRILHDFPDAKILHVIRNPLSAYRDTKRRPFPLPIDRYLISWNIYHSTVEMYANLHPDNVKIIRYEDLVDDTESLMKEVAQFIGISFDSCMLKPSWNNVTITENIAPWGTVLKSTKEYNASVIDELTDTEKQHIIKSTKPLAKHFKYDEVDYLRAYYLD